jgi:hypothetical protein
MDGDPSDAGSPAPLPIEIVESVARVLGTGTTELPPMHDYVDLEAVDLRPIGGAPGPAGGRYSSFASR